MMSTPHVIPSKRCHASAFTLIELLVVVAVIAILMSIMLPSLSEARRQARTVKCAAQMRAFGQGMSEYATEWDGAILGNAHTSGSFLLNPPVPPATVPTAAANYYDGTTWQPLSNLSCPNISQI